MAKLNANMVQLRSLLPSVSKEVKISMTELDAIQGHFRMCLSTLEILANLRPSGTDRNAMAQLQQCLSGEHRHIRRQLVGMARALRDGATERLERNYASADADAPNVVPGELIGYRLLTLQLVNNLDGLQQRLAKTASRWKI